MSRVLGLARTQYLEVSRQPLFGVLVGLGLVLTGLSPLLSVFALGDADAMVLDLAVSSQLFFSAFLAATAVAAGFAEQLESKTTTLILTHPVGPGGVVLGAFLGSAAALAHAGWVLTAGLLLVVRNGAEQLVGAVVWPAGAAVLLTVGWGVRASLRRQSFQAATLRAASLLLPLAYVASLGVEIGGHTHRALDPVAAAAGYLATLAAIAFAGLGVALATRLAPGAAATLTLVGFVVASVIQGLEWGWVLGAALPDVQLFWIVDAAYTDRLVPLDYLGRTTLYAALYGLGATAIGGFWLGGRELG